MLFTPSTKPVPYLPQASELPTFMPPNLAIATRTIFVTNRLGSLQYLVYREGFSPENDPNLNHILSSGSDLSNALVTAAMRLSKEALPPSHYWERLKGCTFGVTDMLPGDVAVQHAVFSPSGELMAQAEYREQAAHLALHRALVGCTDLTFKEFSAISTSAMVEPGGRGTFGLLFSDQRGRDGIRAILKHALTSNESTQIAAKKLAAEASRDDTTPTKAGLPTRRPLRDNFVESGPVVQRRAELDALVSACIRVVLTTPCGEGKHFQHTHNLAPEDGKWRAYIVAHSVLMSPKDAMRTAYDQLMKADVDEQQEEPALAPAA